MENYKSKASSNLLVKYSEQMTEVENNMFSLDHLPVLGSFSYCLKNDSLPQTEGFPATWYC